MKKNMKENSIEPSGQRWRVKCDEKPHVPLRFAGVWRLVSIAVLCIN